MVVCNRFVVYNLMGGDDAAAYWSQQTLAMGKDSLFRTVRKRLFRQ